ncbi:acyl-CoA-binding domain-containing protein 6 isoform X12 [Chroicocephalus ridibundus]|uniref:acyl-CoA-binding domain-containing protein 6 isoform X12 n=1 Tax=Chroicocephalus ridibundus TaxID=1192867 RepID=UPI002FDDC9A5
MSRSGQRPLRNPRARCAFPAGQPVRAYRGVRGTGAAADLGGRRAAMASPPLVAAGAGSGGEASSGSEETGTAAPPGRDLAALFEQAAERLPALLPAASKEQLLYLYARYKQVKFGTCNTPKPSFFDFEGKQKWEAWKALGDISPHQAMQEYIATVKKLDPSWNPQTAEKRGKESKTAFGGPVVSSLYQEETIRAGLCSTGRATEDTRSWFQYCYSMLLTLTASLWKRSHLPRRPCSSAVILPRPDVPGGCKRHRGRHAALDGKKKAWNRPGFGRGRPDCTPLRCRLRVFGYCGTVAEVGS